MRKNFFVIFTILVAVLMISLSANAITIDGVYYNINGDVDGDGKITAADARLTLRESVGLENLYKLQFYAADYDDNGRVTASDARAILRVSVGLDAEDTKEDETTTYYNPYKDPNYDDSNLDIMSIWGCSPERAGLIYRLNGTRTTYEDLAEGEHYFEYDENGYAQLKQKPYSPGNEPTINPDLCSRCGKEMKPYDGKHFGCYYGYCESWLKDINCPECGVFVKARTCHTCNF